MNTYSRALRHIDMKDVKQKHQQKLIENEIKKEQEKKYLEELTFKNSPEYSNWRSEISEQMTTADVFYTTLPANGDVNLQYPTLVSGGGNNGSISNNTITIGGDPAPYLTNGIILKFDSSLYDTLKFNVNIPSGNILGFLIGNSPSASLIVTSSGTYTLKVPQSKNLSIVLDVIESSTVTISNFSFQRRTPLNVFVSLDSPEAASFIRTGSGDLSPEEKQKKLKEMLEASDEYVQQMYGDEFPGTGAVPPGEAGDTPDVETIDYGTDLTPLSDNPYGTEVGQIAGKWGRTPAGATKFLQDLMKDGFGDNKVRTTVNGVMMTGKPWEIINQIKLNFPGGV